VIDVNHQGAALATLCAESTPPVRLFLFNRMVGFCRGAACYALRRRRIKRQWCSGGCVKIQLSLFCRGVACFRPQLAAYAAPARLFLFNRMVGFCRGAACYALRRKAHKKAMVFRAQ